MLLEDLQSFLVNEISRVIFIVCKSLVLLTLRRGGVVVGVLMLLEVKLDKCLVKTHDIFSAEKKNANYAQILHCGRRLSAVEDTYTVHFLNDVLEMQCDR